MEFLGSVVAWLAEPVHWAGPDGIPTRLFEHATVCAIAVLVATAIALPIGLAIGHTGRGATVAVNLANLGQAIPSLAILAIFLPVALRAGLGLGFAPTLIAMTILAIPPIVTNAYIGVREVDATVVEAGRAMGMRGRQVLSRLEMPLALPLIVGGIRTAAVQVVATATLGALVAYGGLGRYIVDGIAQRDLERVFVGAALVALLAIATEALFVAAQRLAEPRDPALRRTERAAAAIRA